MGVDAVRVAAVDNAGPNTLLAFLLQAIRGSTSVDAAVAFVTTAGLDATLHLLKNVTTGRVRFLTGLYQGVTEPEALRVLHRVQAETAGRVSVRLSRDPHFHWKAYFVIGKARATAVIGSSNLTREGLCTSGEFNVVVTMPKRGAAFVELHDPFEREWSANSVPLHQGHIEKYKTDRELAGLGKRVHSLSVSKILGKTPVVPQPEAERRYWRDYINGQLQDETTDLIGRVTNWDRRGWSYFNTFRPLYHPGHHVILFDTIQGTVQAVEIKDTTRTPVPTVDGRHFAAYVPLKNSPRRKLVPRRWKKFKEAGLVRRKADVLTAERLSQDEYARYIAVLRKA